jgi:hypothetical protein
MHWNSCAGAHSGGCARYEEKRTESEAAAPRGDGSDGASGEHRCNEKRAQLQFNRATSAAIVHAAAHQFRV